MKIENLKIGNTYYVSKGRSKGVYHSYIYGKLVEIISNKRVVIEKPNGNREICKIDLLHKSADKAVGSRKAKEAAKRQMKLLKRAEDEKLVDSSVQHKVNRLGKDVYATKTKTRYIVMGYPCGISFKNLEELEGWADSELEKLNPIKEDIKAGKYKHLCVTCKDGHKEYYTIINISLKNFQIQCKHFRGTNNDIVEEKLLDRNNVPGFNLKIHK